MARLGSKKNPVCVRVPTEEHLYRVAELCNEHGLQYIAELAPGEPANLADLERALIPPPVAPPQLRVGRNDSCPCGSGRKFKRCCVDSPRPAAP